ncbi:MAG TPA: AsmA family protein [Candidatus Methylomirabilis sp.]|jgi:AsmA protein|nr:AsmA family protein [Candidatus Methylomirabilis sp.]
MAPRRLKIALALAAGALVLVVLLLLLLPSLIPADRYRALIAAKAGEALGRPVSVGAARLTILPGVGAEATDLTIGEDPAFGREPFLRAKAVQVRVALLPLLTGRVEVSRAIVEAPRLTLVRDTRGQWNVATLGAGKPEGGAARSTPSRGSEPAASALSLPLLPSRLDLTEGAVTVRDLQKKGTVALRNLEVSLRQGEGTRPTGFRLRAALGDQSRASLSVTGEAGPWPAEADLRSIPLSIEVKARRLSPSHLTPLFDLAALGISAAGPADLDLRLRGKLGAARVEGSIDFGALALGMGRTFRKGSGEPGKLTLAGSVGSDRLDLTRLELLLKGAEIRGSLSVERFAAPRVEFDLASPSLDLNRFLASPAPRAAFSSSSTAWAAAAPPALPVTPVTAAGRLRVDRLAYGGLNLARLSARLEYQERTLSASELSAGLEGGTVQGGGAIRMGAVPEVKVDVTLRGIRTGPVLRALLKPDWTLEGTLGLHLAAKGRGASLEELLKTLDGNGRLAVEDGRLGGYRPAQRLEEALGPLLAARGIVVKLDRFERLTGSYTLAAGFLRTTDLLLVQGENRVAASGRYGLTDRSLDFDVVARTPRATIDAKVLGTVDKPRVLPGAGAIQKKLGRELEKRLGPGGAAPLQDLFRQLLKP